MKKKFIIIIFMLVVLTFFSGITYSMLHSSVSANTNQNIAKFIFNTENLEKIDLSLNNLNPGDKNEYLFSVNNTDSKNISDVSVEYQIIIKTYHFVPLVINLYKIDDGTETLIMSCDESYTRNSDNELICNAPLQSMLYSSKKIDNYKLKIEFPSEYNDIVYSNLVDYISIGIKSWQKV